MWLGRALLRWQLIAIPVLPLWLLIGYGVFGAGPAGFFLLFLGCAVLFVFLAVIAGLTRLRPVVRERRALGGRESVLLLAWHAALVGLGFFSATGVGFAVASVVLGLGVFWLTVWQLAREWRDRVSGAVAPASSPSRPTRHPGDDGDVIIVHEAGR